MLKVEWRALSSTGTQAPVLGPRVEHVSDFLPITGTFLHLLEVSSSGPPMDKPSSRNQSSSVKKITHHTAQRLPENPWNWVGRWCCERLLPLEIANQKKALKIKQENLMNKDVAKPKDTRLQLLPWLSDLQLRITHAETWKGQSSKRYLVTRGKKMLKNFCNTNSNIFKKMCKEWGLEYTFPPVHN